jgi:AcrR family transcriptional regulator
MKALDTRDRILDAALRLISERGFLGTTTREIAQEVGMAELTLFRHFGSKERLFEEVLGRYTFLPRLKELLPGLEGLPYEDALRSIGMSFFETLRERKSLVRIMLSEITVYPEKVKAVHRGFIDELFKTLAGYFGGLQERGLIEDSCPPEVLARAYLGMIFAYFQAEEIFGERIIKGNEAARVIGKFAGLLAGGTLKTPGQRKRA